MLPILVTPVIKYDNTYLNVSTLLKLRKVNSKEYYQAGKNPIKQIHNLTKNSSLR